MKVFNASALLAESAARHRVDFSVLVAETSLWAAPQVHAELLASTGSAAWFPNTRRGRLARGENRGLVVDGIRFDDNTYANQALKKALGLGRSKIIGFETCHVWPITCYDTRYHTAIANLVLIPRSLAAFSDHDLHIQRCLQYRAFELYGWYPEGCCTPDRPANYPSTWQEPLPDPRLSLWVRSNDKAAAGVQQEHADRISENVRRPDAVSSEIDPEERKYVESRIERWAGKRDQKVHKIIAIVVQERHGISRSRLVQEIETVTGSKDANGALRSLMTSKGNNYGRALLEEDGIVRVHPCIVDKVAAYRWYR